MSDKVNHPKHYTFSKIEVLDVIVSWRLSYVPSNILKYIARCNFKDDKIEDLEKALWYLQYWIRKGMFDNSPPYTHISKDCPLYIERVLEEWNLDTHLSIMVSNIFFGTYWSLESDMVAYIENLKSMKKEEDVLRNEPKCGDCVRCLENNPIEDSDLGRYACEFRADLSQGMPACENIVYRNK